MVVLSDLNCLSNLNDSMIYQMDPDKQSRIYSVQEKRVSAAFFLLLLLLFSSGNQCK